MARKPNYNFERMERDRLKAIKVAEKAVEAYGKVAADAKTTLIVPSDMTQVSGLIVSAMKMVQSSKTGA